MADILKMTKKDLFNMWKTRMLEYLKEGGFNPEGNTMLLEKMFNSAQSYAMQES